MLTCCFISLKKPFGNNLEDAKNELRKYVHQAIEDGFTRFITNFVYDLDIYFARLILEIKREVPNIWLEAAISYHRRYEKLLADRRTNQLIAACDVISIRDSQYSRRSYTRRLRFMVEQSNRIIVACTVQENREVSSIKRYAIRKRRELIEITYDGNLC